VQRGPLSIGVWRLSAARARDDRPVSARRALAPEQPARGTAVKHNKTLELASNTAAEPATAITKAEFRELKRAWRACRLASWLSRHAICANRDIGGDAAVLAWFEVDRLRCGCRLHGQTIEIPGAALPRLEDYFWAAVCVGVVTEHPQLFGDDPSGETLGTHVNRLSLVLRRAALLSMAGRDGATVH